jgi:hypothetical protein
MDATTNAMELTAAECPDLVTNGEDNDTTIMWNLPHQQH